MAAKAAHEPRQKSANLAWPGALDAFGEIWKQIKINPHPALLYAAVSIGLSLLDYSTRGTAGRATGSRQYFSYESIASLAFMLALPTYGLALAKKRVITLNEFIDFDFRKYLYVFAATILFVTILLVSAVALLIPLFWTISWFTLSILPVVDQGLDPVAALKESKRLSEQHKGKVWGIIGFSVLSAIPALAFSLVPFVGVTAVALYTCVNFGIQAKLYLYLKQTVKAA